MSGRPINADRQNAISLGFKTYMGAPHPKCGMTERYVSGGGCVHCARTIASEQREARKFLIANAALEAEQRVRDEDGVEEVRDFGEVNSDHEAALDNVEQVVSEIVDEKAAAREVFEQSVEDLM